MRTLNYSRLKNISLTVKPYRGSTNRFPIVQRRHNNKYFLVEEEGGETVFKIVYGVIHELKIITPEEGNALKNNGKNVFLDSATNLWKTWVRNPNVVGVVRSDNTFEFTASSYALGTLTFLSNMSRGWFANDSRRGGMVYRERSCIELLPIYYGMRVDCDSMTPTKNITVIGRTVDRKASKKLLRDHNDFFTVAETMCKAISLGAWLDTSKDIYLEHNIESMKGPQILSLAASMKNTAPLDAVILYALGMNIDCFRGKIKNPSNWSRHRPAIDMFLMMKRKLVEQLYKEGMVFHFNTYEMGKEYPPSIWGRTLMVDGVEVKQYGYGV